MEVKDLREKLKESELKYKGLLRNMFKLQESYNSLKESTKNVNESEIIELRKQLAVERRGMSYNQVSELLEGATTSEDIENRLNSLSSLGRKRQANLVLDKGTLTESTEDKRLSGLASIVAKV